jgi:hypothetical protein
MDSVPRDSHPNSPVQLTEASELQSELGGEGDDPYSQGPQALSGLLGSLIALTAAVVPLLMVLTGRSFPNPTPSFDGSGAALQQKSFVAESLKYPGRISKASSIDKSR